MDMPFCRFSSVIAVMMTTVPASLAQDESAAPMTEKPDWALQLSIEPFGSYGLETDLDKGGDVSVARVGARMRLAKQVNATWTLGLNLAEEFSFLDFSAPAGLGGADPVDTLSRLEFIPSATWTSESKLWSATFGPRFEIARESGADDGDSFIVGGFVTVRRQINDSFSIGLGASVSSRFEDDVLVVPLPVIDWRVNDTLRVYSERVGINVRQQLSEQWVVTFKARYEPREFRLDDSASAPLPDGVLRDESVLLGVEVAWRPAHWIEAALEIGGVVYQDFELLNSSGDEVFDDSTDPTFFVAGRVVLRF